MEIIFYYTYIYLSRYVNPDTGERCTLEELVDIFAEKPGKSSEKEFSEWSVNSSAIEEFTQTNPVSYKTLNLEKFVSVLNAVSSDTFKKTLNKET